DQATGELELHIEGHLAGVVRQRLEVPRCSKFAEGALHQRHVHLTSGHQSIMGREGMMDSCLTESQLTHDYGFRATQYTCFLAALHELRIALNVVNQIIHLLCRMHDQGATLDAGRHNKLSRSKAKYLSATELKNTNRRIIGTKVRRAKLT